MSETAASVAGQLLRQYGDDVIATLRAAEVAAQGDVDALVHWDAVIAILEGADTGPAN